MTSDLRDAVNNEIASHDEIRDLKELRNLRDFKELRQMGAEVDRTLRDVERVARDEARKGEQELMQDIDGSHAELPEDGPFGSVANPAGSSIAPPASAAANDAPSDAVPAGGNGEQPSDSTGKTATKR